MSEEEHPVQVPTLQDLLAERCETFTEASGINCATPGSGRILGSYYGATEYCWPCNLRAVIHAEETKSWGKPAPDGWFMFGSHVDFDGPIEFSTEVGEDGLPLWERHPSTAPCTCGYGGMHEPANPRCERNQKVT